MSEWDCFWPNLLFNRYPPTNGLYRGDVLNLRSGRMPAAFRSRQSETTLNTLFARQGINPATLIDLKYPESATCTHAICTTSVRKTYAKIRDIPCHC